MPHRVGPEPEETASGLKGDEVKRQQPDTPGRPKTASSRQQTQPGQTTQTGSEELDTQPARKRPG